MDANIRPVFANYSLKSLVYRGMTIHQHTVPCLYESGKLQKKFLVRPGQQSLDLSVIESIWQTIKLKLQSENDEIKMRAELINAVCKIFRLLLIGLCQNLYVYIQRRLHSAFSNSWERISHKVLTIQGNIGSFSCRILRFLLMTSGSYFCVLTC